MASYRSPILILLLFSCLLLHITAFIVPSPSSKLSGIPRLHQQQSSAARERGSTVMLLSPHDIMGHADPAWLSHVIQGIADAAAPVVDVVEEVKKEPGLFDKLVNVVMSAIEGVHGK